ncbi:MAG: hypothetical protein Q7V48_14345 [Deltaproteobacteria bacterium]|nr:hypothetical protein [Deltaproteobacteria bacterium]
MGFFARVDFRLKRVKRVMVPAVLMILTYEVKQLMGISRAQAGLSSVKVSAEDLLGHPGACGFDPNHL